MIFKKVFLISLILFSVLMPAWSFITISDLTNDRSLTIIIDLDEKESITPRLDLSSDYYDVSSDYSIGNRWYLGRKVTVSHDLEMGVSGSKDFILQRFMLHYRFVSRDRHAFAIRTHHLGFAPGAFSGNLTFYNFSVMAGFEYLFKAFSNADGLYFWIDAGGSNGGFAFQVGAGLGSRFKDGIELSVAWLQDVGVFSNLDFFFLIQDAFVLRGKIGINAQMPVDMSRLDFFSFNGSLWVGGQFRKAFRLLVGGGFTVNEYSFFNGFGGFSVVFQVP
jgi:hypothetical protein